MTETEWDRGYQAGVDGVENADNPYYPGTVAYDQWLFGWLEHAHEIMTHGPA